MRKKLENQGVNVKLAHFIDRQVTLSEIKENARRYTQFDKKNAYEIFCESRPAYRILQSYLQLPSQQTLTRFVSSTLSAPGINTNVLNALKEVLNGNNETERLFALVFD